MDEMIDEVILVMLANITRTTKSEDMARITQSAMNLAHVKATLAGVPPRERKTKGASVS